MEAGQPQAGELPGGKPHSRVKSEGGLWGCHSHPTGSFRGFPEVAEPGDVF